MIQKPKGTYDVYGGNKAKNILYIENLLRTLMEKYNYEYFRTPLFEASELFHRGVGETTDIVSKETYDFKDR
ncbi:MAG: histidine--tRNA ligase, partial [Bacilli bacterium]|nr:histidine--tRNA ligase [Bacilli bacterium]MDD4608432.1 histidine--tRNA ligase [Bacilli bacterium]